MKRRVATTAVFFIDGAMVRTWSAHIPYMQDRVGVSKATIGVALLCMALGALVALPAPALLVASASHDGCARPILTRRTGGPPVGSGACAGGAEPTQLASGSGKQTFNHLLASPRHTTLLLLERAASPRYRGLPAAARA